MAINQEFLLLSMPHQLLQAMPILLLLNLKIHPAINNQNLNLNCQKQKRERKIKRNNLKNYNNRSILKNLILKERKQFSKLRLNLLKINLKNNKKLKKRLRNRLKKKIQNKAKNRLKLKQKSKAKKKNYKQKNRLRQM